MAKQKRESAPTAPPLSTLSQGIHPDVMYPLPTIREIAKWGNTAVSNARADGLKITYRGRGAFVLGRDFIDFVRNAGTTERP